MKDGVTIRVSRRGEEELLGQTAYASFREGEPEGWVNYFREHSHRSPEDTLVAVVDGAVAGHATALRLTMSLCGVDVPMRGVAAVAVLPDRRRRGIADRLMRDWMRRLHRRGEALSLLYPFSAPFYRKFGYGTAEWGERLHVAPHQLPASPLGRNVRILDRQRDLAAVRATYERSRAGTTGPLLRSDYWWDVRIMGRVADGVVYVDPAGKRIDGYALYEVPKEPRHPAQHLNVRELAWASPDALRGLLGWFESLGEQYAMIRLDFPRGQGGHLLRIPEAVGGAAISHIPTVGGFVTSGAMARLVDVAAAFALHPAPARNGARGRIGLDLDDPILPAQAKPHDVTFSTRGAAVEPGASARDRLSLSVDRLAQIYFAGSSARDLLDQGAISGSPRAAELLDRAFAGAPLFFRLTNFF
jgi:predicted acetyltransferase